MHTLQTETEALKRQVHSLTMDQTARSLDFLALCNQTLAFRSDVNDKGNAVVATRFSQLLGTFRSNEFGICKQNLILEEESYAGDVRYTEPGSAAAPICLPKDPDSVRTTCSGDNGHIFETEFYSDVFAPDRKNKCYTGWNMEYYGYLASNHYINPGGSCICIDIQPEYVSGESSWNTKSKLLYGFVAKCGSLNCPPYKQDHPLTCVVR
ncbi:unnamed protein product [Mytilus coruscus]|uniref:Uncharacterized protein n=1 Tax=Mytilus coruscus TaxID=42192 RepID=A0A6J8EKK6_MYTCO|nr:unnamed protein product [Mytilus coruscus]